MKILYVVNNHFAIGNGLSASCRRTVQALRDAGQDVRVLSVENPDPNGLQPDYPLKFFYFPLAQPIITAFGYSFADWRSPKVEEAVRWADVVHLEEPFFVEHAAMNWAKKLGKPVTGTYHMHPENIFCQLGMGGWHLPNKLMLKYWKRVFIENCLYVQCPTENVYDRMLRYHVKTNCEVISNGVIPDACIRPLTPPADYLDPNRPFKVIYIGRIATEKDQQTLVDAIQYSKYRERIQLFFAGQGLGQKRFQRKLDRLYKSGIVKYKPILKFYNRDEVRQLAASADLAVHCATIEVEGLSIMEAMQQAVVPVIAMARYAGTSQFALDRRSKFPKKNREALAKRIDYWLDNPEERWRMGFVYAESMKQYDIAESAKQLVRMYEKAIELNNSKKQ